MHRFHRVASVTTAATICALTFSTLPPIAHAGVNAGGVLLAHTNAAVVYTTDASSYCGQSGLVTCDAIAPETTGDAPSVIFVLAAFPTGSLPRMSGTVFGIQYGSDVNVIAFGPCADFELRTTGWPASGEGTALAWNAPRTGLLSEVYWFAAYAYGGAEGELALAPHPTQGASFADDSVPSLLDPIADFGRFGFNQDGYAPCPSGNPIGVAACRPGTASC